MAPSVARLFRHSDTSSTGLSADELPRGYIATPHSGLSRMRKQMPSQGFPKEGFGCRRGSAESTFTLEAMGVAELLLADPLTGGRAVACQLLAK
jgi:hypothetical protein